jgi:hypothetical protein
MGKRYKKEEWFERPRVTKKWAVYKVNADNSKGIGMALIMAETFEDALFAATMFFNEILPQGFIIEPAPRGFLSRDKFVRRPDYKPNPLFRTA